MSKIHVAEQFSLPGVEVVPVKPNKPRYSYSALESAKCGMRYYHNKYTATVKEETYNLAAGTLLDTAFNAYYENNQHLEESHQQRLDYARAAIEVALQEHPSWLAMPWSQKAGDVRSSPENYIAWLFDLKAIELVCRHDRGPVSVQRKVEVELPNYSIVGYIDCLELSTNTIVDIKAVTGYNAITPLTYALRSQVPLYRMLLKDLTGETTKGRYELLLCRKSPKLLSVPDMDISYLQDKLIEDFDKHHEKLTKKKFEKNPNHCFDFNKMCPHFKLCWPELSELAESTVN